MNQMNGNSKNWLQIYVDAMTEKDPHKRLALVRELQQLLREVELAEVAQGVEKKVHATRRPKPARKTKTVRQSSRSPAA